MKISFLSLPNPRTTIDIVKEYRDLIQISLPSDEQLDRIENILEMAIYDTELNNYLYQVDTELSVEINSLENDYSNLEEFEVSEQLYIEDMEDGRDECFSQDLFSRTNKTVILKDANVNRYPLLQKKEPAIPPKETELPNNLIQFPLSKILNNQELVDKSISIANSKQKLTTNSQISPHQNCFLAHNIIPKASSVLTVGILAIVIISAFNIVNYKRGSIDKYSLPSRLFPAFFSNTSISQKTSLTNDSITEVLICNVNLGTPSKQIQDYYVLYTQLKEKVKSKELQPLEIKMLVRKLQNKAEIQQEQSEKEQKDAEKEKKQAERRKDYDIAQKWKNKASDSLAKSRQWLCLGRYVLDLSK
jgi:hypothetical protein